MENCTGKAIENGAGQVTQVTAWCVGAGIGAVDGKIWENSMGKAMRKWKNHRKSIGKVIGKWENHRKSLRGKWRNHGKNHRIHGATIEL